MKKLIKRVAFVAGSMGVSVVAFAAPPDYTSLTSSVDFAGVVTAILAVAATIAGLYVAIRGAKTVIGMIRG